jgi:hypothetical protein
MYLGPQTDMPWKQMQNRLICCRFRSYDVQLYLTKISDTQDTTGEASNQNNQKRIRRLGQDPCIIIPQQDKWYKENFTNSNKKK